MIRDTSSGTNGNGAVDLDSNVREPDTKARALRGGKNTPGFIPSRVCIHGFRATAWTLVSALLFAGLLSSCSDGGKTAADKDTAEPVFPVTVTHVITSNISSKLSVSGTVAALPNQDVRVSSQVAGRVDHLAAAVGDAVRNGEILATIDSQSYRQRLAQAEAAVSQAQANLSNAEFAESRDQTLFERGIVAKKYLEADKAQAAVAQGAVKQMQAALALAQINLARTQVRSPIAGLVVKRFVSDGEQVNGTAAEPIYEVADLHEVELYANVPATYFSQIHVGETLPVTTDALPGKTLHGQIVAISPSVDPTTNIGIVRIRMANPAGALRLGMYLSANIAIEAHQNVLVIPLEALYRNASNRAEVYRIEGQWALATPVEVGIATNNRAEIVSGVHDGESIVLSGAYGFGARTQVKVQP